MWKKIEDIAVGELSLEDYTKEMFELEAEIPVALRHVLGLKTEDVEEVIDPDSVDAHEAALLEAEEATAARTTWLTSFVHEQVMHLHVKTPLPVGQSFLTILEALSGVQFQWHVAVTPRYQGNAISNEHRHHADDELVDRLLVKKGGDDFTTAHQPDILARLFSKAAHDWANCAVHELHPRWDVGGWLLTRKHDGAASGVELCSQSQTHLIRLPAEQEGVRLLHQRAEGRTDVVVPVRHGPAAVLEPAIGVFFGTAGGLNDAIERNEL